MERKKKGGTVKIGDLFQKYKQKLIPPERTVITTFCEVMEDLVGSSIDAKNVTYNPYSRILTLKVGGVVRSEMRLRKKEILAHLSGRLGVGHAPKDII